MRVCCMGDQQCALHSQITFLLPWKLGLTPVYLIKPTQGNISIADQQYHNNIHNYHLVKNMNSALKKIVVAASNNQWLKRAKDLVMGYANKKFVELVDL